MIQVLNLGHVDYNAALELQKTLVDLRKRGAIHDTLLLLEHPPVITLGRNAKQRNIVASPEFLAQKGVEVVECDRGGDVTFHGPGQLVGYPIFDLRALNPKIGAIEYVRRIEEVLIRSCGDLGIPTTRVQGLTGVWTTDEPAAKIAAIGVHISRAVTSHGFALNVTTDLDYFKLIVPCGISDKPVTSIERELGRSMSLEEAMPVVTRNFGFVFKEQVLWLESLNDLLPPQDLPARAPEELRQLHGEDIHLA
jgi:lipoyl(octanoyl) transferase